MVKFSDVVLKIKEVFSVKPETVEKAKIGFWGLIGGAAIAMLIGFNLGGWSTANATQKLSDEAVLKSQAAICVAQFINASKNTEMIQVLGKVNSYDRPDYITKGGWDKMPGQKEASTGVSQACSEGLQTLLATK